MDATTPDQPRFSLEELIRAADCNFEFAREVIGIFIQDMTQLVEEIQMALEWGDVRAVERIGHMVSASSANMGAVGMSEIASEIEASGREGSLDQAAGTLAVLAGEVSRLALCLEDRIVAEVA